jgi:hypothetical protein
LDDALHAIRRQIGAEPFNINFATRPSVTEDSAHCFLAAQAKGPPTPKASGYERRAALVVNHSTGNGIAASMSKRQRLNAMVAPVAISRRRSVANALLCASKLKSSAAI